MKRRQRVEVAVLGAGPAGLTAALRLQQLGRSVALIERSAFPRPNLGEALTPGIGNILKLLDAPAHLHGVLDARGIGGMVLWESAQAVPREPAPMIDRGAFDLALHQLFAERGGRCLAPQKLANVDGGSGEWRLALHDGAELDACIIIDARGRATDASLREPCAPPMLALWTDLQQGPPASLVEAIEAGWLWGARRPDGSYRIMAFCSPSSVHRYGGGRTAWLAHQLSSSRLFQPAAVALGGSEVKACNATPQRHRHPWQDGLLKAGDAAFSIDPLASSGTEKAMRCGLQAAVAVNTVLHQPDDAGLAQRFYEGWLDEAVRRHADWAREFYRRAWPGDEDPFWRERRSDFPLSIAAPFAAAAPGAATIEVPCVVDDRVRLQRALLHPGLERPVAFVAGQELAPLFDLLPPAPRHSQAIELWSRRMAPGTASHIADWLQQRGVLAPG